LKRSTFLNASAFPLNIHNLQAIRQVASTYSWQAVHSKGDFTGARPGKNLGKTNA
jgi:hypothetical protein